MKRLITICAILLLAGLLGDNLRVHVDSQNRRKPEQGQSVQPQPVTLPGTIPSDQGPVDETNARSSPPAIERDVSLSISGLKSQPSNIFVAVYQSASDFPKPASDTKTVVLPSTETLLELTLPLLENHPVAIGVFQDLDGNGILTKNVIGMPAEPYGFTNNIRASFGPPTFSQSMIQVNAQTKSLEIQLR